MTAIKGAYPIVILEDRYHGVYSGGPWLAISEADAIDDLQTRVGLCLFNGPHGDDCDAMLFWSDPPKWIAVGNTPDDALEALRKKLEAP